MQAKGKCTRAPESREATPGHSIMQGFLEEAELSLDSERHMGL